LVRFVKEPSISLVSQTILNGVENFDDRFWDRSICSPEYKLSKLNSNKRDVWSFGVFLWKFFDVLDYHLNDHDHGHYEFELS
jgi:hypothetical protein